MAALMGIPVERAYHHGDGALDGPGRRGRRTRRPVPDGQPRDGMVAASRRLYHCRSGRTRQPVGNDRCRLHRRLCGNAHGFPHLAAAARRRYLRHHDPHAGVSPPRACSARGSSSDHSFPLHRARCGDRRPRTPAVVGDQSLLSLRADAGCPLRHLCVLVGHPFRLHRPAQFRPRGFLRRGRICDGLPGPAPPSRSRVLGRRRRRGRVRCPGRAAVPQAARTLPVANDSCVPAHSRAARLHVPRRDRRRVRNHGRFPAFVKKPLLRVAWRFLHSPLLFCFGSPTPALDVRSGPSATTIRQRWPPA